MYKQKFAFFHITNFILLLLSVAHFPKNSAEIIHAALSLLHAFWLCIRIIKMPSNFSATSHGAISHRLDPIPSFLIFLLIFLSMTHRTSLDFSSAKTQKVDKTNFDVL